LAQNGSGFTKNDMDPKNLPLLPKDKRTNDYILDWDTYFQDSIKKGSTKNTITQLNRFTQAINGLTPYDWVLPTDPPINWTYVKARINQH
jgi:hypothetical protein